MPPCTKHKEWSGLPLILRYPKAILLLLRPFLRILEPAMNAEVFSTSETTARIVQGIRTGEEGKAGVEEVIAMPVEVRVQHGNIVIPLMRIRSSRLGAKSGSFVSTALVANTAKVGFYNLSHTSFSHQPNFGGAGTATGSGNATGSGTAPDSSAATPGGNLAAIETPVPGVTFSTGNDLDYIGFWLALVDDDDVDTVDDDDDDVDADELADPTACDPFFDAIEYAEPAAADIVTTQSLDLEEEEAVHSNINTLINDVVTPYPISRSVLNEDFSNYFECISPSHDDDASLLEWKEGWG
jgi:hypothetical protein